MNGKFYILASIFFVLFSVVVSGFTANSSNFVLQKSSFGASVLQGNNSNFKIESTLFHNIVGNRSSENFSFCLGYYCIEPSFVAVVVSEILGPVGGGCPGGMRLVLFEDKYFCASQDTIVQFQKRKTNLHIFVVFIIFLCWFFWDNGKRKRKWQGKKVFSS